jgi:hypothetical protein
MNIIKVAGGLGNQLFQYAFGKVQESNGITVLYDINWYNNKHTESRPYTLDKFQVEINSVSKMPRSRVIHEKGFNLSFLKKNGFYFSGYWQYPAYYEKILPVLRKEFCIRKELYTKEFIALREEIIMNNNAIAVHVRRGDYLRLSNFPVLPIEYYLRALERVRGDVYVFSDDMEWCRENFKGVKFIHLNEYFDFELMKICKHQIISRSSFSWWAAHLNSNPDKIVVAPKEQIIREGVVGGVFDPKEWILC